MPRLYKGTETILKLYVPSCDESNIDNLKIGLFTDDPNNATEFYSDNMSIDGDTVFLRVNPWSFDLMNDGVINYVATIETDNDTIVQERQSNYFLKTPNVYTPTGGGNADLSDYYTKDEVDEEIVSTKKWVQEQKYATEEWVQEQDGNIIGYVDTTLNFYSTKEEANATANSIRGDINDIKNNKIGLVSGDEIFAANYGEYKVCDLKTVNGESIIGSGDISVAGGSGGVFEIEGANPTIEQFNEAVTLFQQGKRVVFKQGEMVCTVIGASEKYIQVLYGDTYTTFIDTMSASGDNVYGFKAKHKSNYNGKPFDETLPIYDFPNLAMYGPPSNVKGLTHAIQYKNWYISATVNPDTLDVSCVLGDKLYVWNYANGEKDAKGYTIPRITDLATQGADLSNYYTKEEVDELITNSGGGSTPSTETDSGVYVLEFVDDIHEYLQDGGVRDKLYEGSDRQTHNASVYQAWLEGKVKVLYYKQLTNTWYNEWEGAQYKLIPCMINDTYYWDGDINVRCMTVAALYRSNSDYDPTDIYSISFPMKEDGSIIRDYYVSDYWMYSSEIGIGGVSNNGEGFQLDKIFASQLYNEQYKVGLLNVYDNTGEVPTQERILAKLMVDGDFWGGDATLTVYGTLSNGSLIKWEFQVYSGEILNEIAIAQIIPMEVDLSSYYTKEEVDELIANINLGDGATIESIVANEVANQLTDNFKTINGESILGEGDITIQDNVDLSNYYTKEETNNLIANSGGGSGNIGELFYPTIHTPSIVGEMTFNDEQLPHVDISESVYCNFKARKTQSKDLWVNNIHIGTNTDTVKITSPYYEATENMPDGAQEVYAEFTTEGIKEMGQYLSDKYVSKSKGNTLGNYISEDSAIVALSAGYLNRRVVEKALDEYKALFVDVSQGNFPSTSKRIPVTIERHINSNTETTGYTVWGWYSKTQTITWTFNMTNTDVYYTIE